MSLRLVLAVGGALASAGGLVLMNAPPETIPWAPRGPLERYVHNPAETCAGFALAIVAAAMFAWATRAPRQESPLVVAAVRAPAVGRARVFGAIAVVCAVGLALRLALGRYATGDLLLFVTGLAMATLALRSADRRQARSTGIRWIDIALGFVIAVVTAWVHSKGSTHWLFALIGDEIPFFEMARAIARGEREWNAFDVVGGVYETHAFLDSAYHATVMRGIGRMDVVGWRLSLALLAGASAALLYLAGVVLRGRPLGFAAAAVLGSSHYLMAFSHIGYNNSHAVFYNVLAALMLGLAWRTGRWHHHWLAGVALGLCLYTFLAAAAFWIVAAVVLVTEIVLRRSWRHRMAVAFAALGFAATVAPALWVTRPERLTRVLSKNSVELVVSHHPAAAAGGVQSENLIRSGLALWADEQITGHHLGGRLLDPVTGVLLILGLAAAAAAWRGFAERMALTWFAGGLILVAVSHYEPSPSTSRLLVVLPGVALLSGLAVDRLAVASGRARLAVGGVVCVALVLALPTLNLHQLFVVSPRKMAPNRAVMVMKALQEHAPRAVVDVGTPDGNVPWMLQAYPWLEERYRSFSDGQWHAGEPLPIDGDPIVYVDPSSEPLVDVVPARLPAHYRRVEDRDPSGQYRVVLFVPAP